MFISRYVVHNELQFVWSHLSLTKIQIIQINVILCFFHFNC